MGESGGGGKEGFRRVADDIFGGNDGARKIAMTAPVAQERRPGERDGMKIALTAPVAQEKTGEGWTVTFVMPSEHTMATLPKPNDARVTLRAVPARRLVAVTFSGTCGAERFDAVARELLGRLDATGFVPAGPPVSARYNPPWTPWSLRNDGVLEPLRGGPKPVVVR